MIDRRPKIFFVTLAVLVLGIAASAVLGLRGHAGSSPRPASHFESGAGVAERAWALLAEAEELCRASPGPAPADGREPRSLSRDRAEIARQQVAREALEIVRELAQRAFEPSHSVPILRTERRVRGSCLAGEARTGSVGGSRRSLDGLEYRDRAELLKPFLARLNAAVGSDSDAVPERAESAPVDRVAGPVAAPAVLQPEPQPKPAVVAAAAEETLLEEPARLARGETGLESSKIAIGTASSEYQQRLRRWLLVFEREAGALRAGRRRLQIEIDRRSMAEARGECRRFGLALGRLDASLLEAAPSRGLSSRIERMVERYWRAVGLCGTGRPAAAFAYLNEGDREWAIIAQIAARMREPRRLKPLGSAVPALAPAPDSDSKEDGARSP